MEMSRIPYVLHPGPQPRYRGYLGIWYGNQRLRNEYAFKYSGGLGTYPQQIRPMAVHAPEVGQTFFCYGGTVKGRNLLHTMVGGFDHGLGTVCRPVVLVESLTEDAHRNPALNLDRQGRLWVFSSAHGDASEAFVHRGREPYSLDAFDCLSANVNFSYAQPHFLPDGRLLLLHTRYQEGVRQSWWSLGGAENPWEVSRPLARMEQGHYQVSGAHGARVGVAFNLHPANFAELGADNGLNARTNLYYVETDDGETWRTVDGQRLDVPLRTRATPALVRDYAAERTFVYLKDIQFDEVGNPVILFLTSRSYKPGPEGSPRLLQTAHWTGAEWRIRPVAETGSNYDTGPLYIESGQWAVIAPTHPGPQPFNPGGEMVFWSSPDQGATWHRVRQLTRNSLRNHTYARRPTNPAPEFYAFWADGNAREISESHLYFTDREGMGVWRLPDDIAGDAGVPEFIPDGDCGRRPSLRPIRMEVP